MDSEPRAPELINSISKVLANGYSFLVIMIKYYDHYFDEFLVYLLLTLEVLEPIIYLGGTQ